MGASAAPVEPDYSVPSAQSYPVRAPLLMPRPLQPADTSR
jgi:hypothetical protein